MDLKELQKIQYNFDKNHEWTLETKKTQELIDWLRDDTIGLIGEIGEFSNLVKKATLLREKGDELQTFLHENKENLKEEIIDSFIYIVRIATHLGVDIEDQYLKKLGENEKRFKKFEK